MKHLFSLFFLALSIASHGSNPSPDVSHLLDNQYNKKNLPVGEFSTVENMVNNMEKQDRNHLLKTLNDEDVTLYEASYGLFFLGLTYLHDGDVEKGVKYLKASAEDYLNPLALGEMARIYYHGNDELHHIFPKEHIDDIDLGIEQDHEKSFVILNLAFEIAHEVHKKHHSTVVLRQVSKEGVELLERFTFKNEADELRTTEEDKAKLMADLNKDLELLQKYREMYTS